MTTFKIGYFVQQTIRPKSYGIIIKKVGDVITMLRMFDRYGNRYRKDELHEVRECHIRVVDNNHPYNTFNEEYSEEDYSVKEGYVVELFCKTKGYHEGYYHPKSAWTPVEENRAYFFESKQLAESVAQRIKTLGYTGNVIPVIRWG